jgi:hypothetical protein
VIATLTPSSDSDIKIEVWLPVSGWNDHFQAIGNGGWNGTMGYAPLAEAVKRGFSARRHRYGARRRKRKLRSGAPEKLTDFAYRAVHEMTVTSGPGSELGWSILGGQQAASVASDTFTYIVYKNPQWDCKTMNLDSDVALLDKTEDGSIDAMDPNMKPFFAPGWPEEGVQRCPALYGAWNGALRRRGRPE